MSIIKLNSVKILFFGVAITVLSIIPVAAYSQNLPIVKTTFTKYEVWNKKGEQLLGEKISEGSSNSSIEISQAKSENGDFFENYIEGYIQLMNGKFIEKVLSVQKFPPYEGITGYIADTINGSNRQSRWLLDYKGNQLISISLIVDKGTSVFKILN